MNIWGSGGTSMFDFYSLHHIVWFIAITIIMVVIFDKNAWIGTLAIVIIWEIFEEWVSINIPGFPFVGKELWINKIIGDTISDLIGFIIAIYLVKSIKKQ